MCIYVYTSHSYFCISIYTYREAERPRGTERERERENKSSGDGVAGGGWWVDRFVGGWEGLREGRWVGCWFVLVSVIRCSAP